jgi:CheY-like chemotaxis protein
MMTRARADSIRPAILVVDDSETLRTSLVDWLRFRFPDCRVHATESGEAALAEIHSFCPDVVLMDIDLPGIDGFEATRRIKSQVPSTAVVMLTMHDTPQHRMSAARAGAVAYVPKHTMDQRLHSVLEKLLRALGGNSR